MKKIFLWLSVVCAVLIWRSGSVEAITDQGQVYVILISVDGLRPDAITTLGKKEAPNFYRLMEGGAFTLNARSDPDATVTMPNHVSMLTGRGVKGKTGHEYLDNKSVDLSLHENKGSYVKSIFDVVKEHNLSTAMFVSKLKFKMFVNSYADNSDPKRPSRIDIYSLTDQNDRGTAVNMISQIKDHPLVFSFVHFAQTDQAGHAEGWDLNKGSRYMSSVRQVDHYLGQILEAIEDHPLMKGETVILLTSDHGGTARHHADVTKLENFRIPLIIWGKGVATGMDLYKMNTDLRRDPGNKQVSYGSGKQPIRNGDVANVVCSILGLPFVPGSTIGNPDVLRVNK